MTPGVSYPVELRATPDTDASGHPRFGSVMWSADVQVADGVSLTASGTTPVKALAALQRVIRNA